MNPTTTASTGALAGIKVIDLSRVLGGPYCAQMLADHGADVIKIEPPQGDETRGWGPPFRDDGTASYFLAINRNKRGMALDLSKPQGREVLLRLLRNADVLVENFTTGTMERWGLGYEDVLRERFPRLIHCRISGFGADGPLGGLPGYDAIVQAMSGLMSINGEPEGAPTRVGVPVVDLATGMNACIGILMALVERTRSGKGQFVDAALYDSALALMHPHMANYLMSGKPPQRTGNFHPNISPYDLFATKTSPVYIGIGNDRTFAKFCAEIGRPELAIHPSYSTNSSRVTNRTALTEELAATMAQIDGTELSQRLLAKGIPCGPVLSTAEVVALPHTAHREMVIEDGAGYRGTGNPVKLSRTPAAMYRLPPAFGESTGELLTSMGYTPDEIMELVEARVVFKKD